MKKYSAPAIEIEELAPIMMMALSDSLQNSEPEDDAQENNFVKIDIWDNE